MGPKASLVSVQNCEVSFRYHDQIPDSYVVQPIFQPSWLISFPYTSASRDSSVNIVTGVRFPVKTKNCHPRKTQTGSGFLTFSSLINTGVHIPGQSGQSVTLTTHFHLASRFIITGILSLILHISCRAWRGTSLLLTVCMSTRFYKVLLGLITIQGKKLFCLKMERLMASKAQPLKIKKSLDENKGRHSYICCS